MSHPRRIRGVLAVDTAQVVFLGDRPQDIEKGPADDRGESGDTVKNRP